MLLMEIITVSNENHTKSINTKLVSDCWRRWHTYLPLTFKGLKRDKAVYKDEKHDNVLQNVTVMPTMTLNMGLKRTISHYV
jgi:hypothetical protein